jgi:DNA-binding protein WhiA
MISFSAKVKTELAGVFGNHKHCRKAELTGMFQYGGQLGRVESNCYTVGFHTENEEVLKKGFTLLKKTYNIDFDKNLSEQQLFSFLEKMDAVESESLENMTNRNCCKRAFIRGVFLAVGSISDPEKGYHLEFVCENEEQARFLRNVILTFDIEMKILERKEHFVLYVKEGASIVDLLNVMEAHIALLELENLRIIKEMRNTVNRRVNCETANINKTVNAATKQVEDIMYIEEHGGMVNLPDTLYEMARVRLANPDATLKELGEMLVPPVGKSGVNHRLRKISEYAEKLRDREPARLDE